MTEAERSKYDGRDMVILNRHTEDTIQEDKLSFPMQMENHFAHVRMLWEQGILTHKEARAISAALRKLLACLRRRSSWRMPKTGWQCISWPFSWRKA